MKRLVLLRHSLTEANARRLYCGATDVPLSPEGRALAVEKREMIPPCEFHITSGMKRTDETLYLLISRTPDRVFEGLREMDFGAFEMRSYDELKALPEYQRWIMDETGHIPCPGGESRADFQNRVLAAGQALLNLKADSALVVCHGGVIAALMAAWFPDEPRHFYQWQPAPCEGWRVFIADGRPARFEDSIIPNIN